MTESEFILTTIGHKEYENEKAWQIRKAAWGIITSQSEQTFSEQRWWPLFTDPRMKPVSIAKIRKLHNKFMTTKWTYKGKK